MDAYLAPPGDLAALAHRTCRLLQDRALARRFSQAGREKVRNHYSAVSMTRQLENIYLNYLEGRIHYLISIHMVKQNHFSPGPFRVVLLLQDLFFGGTQRHTLELARGLNPARLVPEKDHETLMAAFSLVAARPTRKPNSGWWATARGARRSAIWPIA